MKFASWSVTSLRARLNNGEFAPVLKKLDADVFALQDIQLQQKNLNEIQNKLYLGNYEPFWNFSKRNGKASAGTAIFSRVNPKNVTCVIGDEDFDIDGRTITLDLGEYFFVNVYIPHYKSQAWNETNTRAVWDNLFRKYLKQLDAVKPVIVAGNFNVAHEPIDLARPDKNRNRDDFRDDIRERFSALLNPKDGNFVDTFRFLHPTLTGAYTWWFSDKFREENCGWRIDYFLVSERLKDSIVDATIESEIYSKNKQCPITLTLN